MRQPTLEYIGAAPSRKQRRSPLGGWLLVAFAIALGGLFLRPLLPFLQAQQDLTSSGNLSEAVEYLESDGDFGSRLAAKALLQTQEGVSFDSAYYEIDFPNGDVPADKGNRADLIVRSFRGVGIDLQQEIHEDMRADFRHYPQIYPRKEADPNIDHRLVPNLQRFFNRKGTSLQVSDEPLDYRNGDIITWRLVDGSSHIGIVVPGPGAKKSEKWVVHHMSGSPAWEDRLFDFTRVGHYQYGQ